MNTEAAAAFDTVPLLAELEHNAAGENITEFLSFVRRKFEGLSSGTDLKQDGFHVVFLSAGYQPDNAAPECFFIGFFKHVDSVKYNFFVIVVF